MHTQHVKFSAYVAWGVNMGGVVAVGVVFEEGEVSRMEEVDDDVDGMVLEVVVVVVVVVFGLPSPPFFLLLVVLLGFIGGTEELIGFSLI
jgi:hypothetical protein